uniref:C2H2-type domain-containing protein n=1 Tax=Syphacia muris TaxID=451379 RepID=A0A0N5AJR1_9BILA
MLFSLLAKNTDVLSGTVQSKDSAGDFLERTTTYQKLPDDVIRNRSQPNGTLQIVLDEDPDYLRNVQLSDQEIEVIEENTVGQVVQGEDGEYYVVVDDNGSDVPGTQQNSAAEVISTDSSTQGYLVQSDEVIGNVRENVVSNEASSYSRTVEATPESSRNASLRRDVKTVLVDSGNGTYEMVQILDDTTGMAVDARGEPINIGAVTTAEASETLPADPFPQGIKMRRSFNINRVYGQCRCSECGQSFVNTARLERHLAVHQIFGSFLCPLCGKTYKYEYNLFFHWRKTCRDLNELVSLDDRKTMDVNALRQLVDDVALKKSEIGQIEIGINRNFLFGTSPYARLEMPASVGCRGTTCRICGIVVPSVHIHRHIALHRGESVVDNRNVSGGFFCDLCGSMFRQQINLIRHWRTNCPEIQANLPEDQDITMDDDGLKRMVTRLVKRSPEDIEGNHIPLEPVPPQLTGNSVEQSNVKTSSAKIAEVSGNAISNPPSGSNQDGTATVPVEAQVLTERGGASLINDERNRLESFEGKWVDEQGIVFADEFVNEDESLMLDNDGLSAPHNRAKWSLSGGPVQCPECFRSFANSGRLERHLAGFHASFGSHHCILCGNRFKYDYNLLYHYRRSCPYTRAFIDHDVREQIDAMNLRKIVRSLSQKEVNLMPHIVAKNRLPFRDPVDVIGSRRQLLRYPTPTNQPPPHLLVPRPGLGRGKSCPVCSVIFYGNIAIERHLKAAHPVEYEDWNLQGLLDSSYLEEGSSRIVMQEIIDEPEEVVEDEIEEVPEPPPTLTAELPVEQPLVSSSQNTTMASGRTVRRAHIEEDEDGNQRIVDENGVVINPADTDVPLQIEDSENLRQFLETVQLQVPDGEIIFVEENDPSTFEGAMNGEQIMDAGGNSFVTTREFVSSSNNVGKFYMKNPLFDELQSATKDVGLEVATILTRMKKQDDHTIGSDIPETNGDSGDIRQPLNTVTNEAISDGNSASSEAQNMETIVIDEGLVSHVKRPRLSSIS